MEKKLKTIGKYFHSTRNIDWFLDDKLLTLYLLTQYHPGSIKIPEKLGRCKKWRMIEKKHGINELCVEWERRRAEPYLKNIENITFELIKYACYRIDKI